MVARLLIGTLLLGLLISGCSSSLGTKGEVSGKVSYNGKPLPGGQINFMTAKGYGFSGTIDPEGNYKVQPLVGEAKISVDNHMLIKDKESTSGSTSDMHRQMESKRPPSAKRSEAPETTTPTIAGTYVPIPEKYRSPDESGLKYTVKPGSQTYNIELSGPGS